MNWEIFACVPPYKPLYRTYNKDQEYFDEKRIYFEKIGILEYNNLKYYGQANLLFVHTNERYIPNLDGVLTIEVDPSEIKREIDKYLKADNLISEEPYTFSCRDGLLHVEGKAHGYNPNDKGYHM